MCVSYSCNFLASFITPSNMQYGDSNYMKSEFTKKWTSKTYLTTNFLIKFLFFGTWHIEIGSKINSKDEEKTYINTEYGVETLQRTQDGSLKPDETKDNKEIFSLSSTFSNKSFTDS